MSKFVSAYFSIEVPDKFSGNINDVLKLVYKKWKSNKQNVKLIVNEKKEELPLYSNIEYNPFLYFFWKDYLEKNSELLLYVESFDEKLLTDIANKIREVDVKVEYETRKKNMQVDLEKLLEVENNKIEN